MSNICLSPAPNLRCQSLQLTELVAILIPAGLEIIFDVGLLVYKRRSRSKLHYLLSGEGMIYFALASADLVAHLVPGIKGSLTAFKAFDIMIGALSTLPLLFFTTYLFVFTSRDLIPTLPSRVQVVTKYTILLCIPLILILNELASFVDLNYRMFETGLRVRFTNESLRLFLNSLALLVLTTFQALCFCGSLYRLIKALINQRRIDVSNQNDQEAHLINGIGWIALGIKFGAVESVVGFAIGLFGSALIRRILRFIGRACLIIGIMKGLDTVEDFRIFDIREGLRRSRILPLISNPIDDSFRQVGGYKYDLSMDLPPVITRSRPLTPVTPQRIELEAPVKEIAPRPSRNLKVPLPKSPRTPKTAHVGTEKPKTPVLSVDTQNITFSSDRRVLIRYQRGRAPTLEIKRLSNFLTSIPSPLTSEGSKWGSTVASPESVEGDKSVVIPTSAYAEDAPRAYSMAFADSPLVGVPLPDRKRIRPEARRTLAASTELTRLMSLAKSNRPRQSTMSYGGQTADANKMHFNPRRSSMMSQRQSVMTYASRMADEAQPTDSKLEILHALAMQSASTIEQPTPQTYSSPTLGGTTVSRASSSRTANSHTGLMRRGSSVKRKPVPALDVVKAEKSAAITAVVDIPRDQKTPRRQQQQQQMSPLVFASAPNSAPSSRALFTHPYRTNKPATRRYTTPESDPFRSPPMKSAGSTSTMSSKIELAWMRDSIDVAAEGYAELDATWKKMGLTKTKSFGNITRKSTPTPSHGTFSRDSMKVEWGITDDARDVKDMI